MLWYVYPSFSVAPRVKKLFISRIAGKQVKKIRVPVSDLKAKTLHFHKMPVTSQNPTLRQKAMAQACLPGKVPIRYLQGQKSGFAMKNRYKSCKG